MLQSPDYHHRCAGLFNGKGVGNYQHAVRNRWSRNTFHNSEKVDGWSAAADQQNIGVIDTLLEYATHKFDLNDCFARFNKVGP